MAGVERNRIAALRDEHSLSQADLADRAGIRVATLSEIETGKGNPRLSTLKRIAGAFDPPVRVTDLFLDTDGKVDARRKLVRIAGRLSPEQLGMLEAVANALLEGAPQPDAAVKSDKRAVG